MQAAAYCIWLNGPPLSGKRTIAQELSHQLEARGCPTQVVESDRLRPAGSLERPRNLETLDELCDTAAVVARTLITHGVIPLVPLVLPSARSRATAHVETHRFVEVLVNTPLAVCVSRDRSHRLYRRIPGEGEPAGFESAEPFDAPAHPEIVVGTADLGPAAAAQRILRDLEALAWPVRGADLADSEHHESGRISKPKKSAA